MSSPYDDIIHLPRPSSARPRMNMAERAAQFSPFAALSGHSAAIAETARLTEARPSPDEACLQDINRLLQEAELPPRPRIRIRYFRPDARKSGGACVEHTGHIRKLLPAEQLILMQDGTRIPMNEVFSAELLEASPFG